MPSLLLLYYYDWMIFMTSQFGVQCHDISRLKSRSQDLFRNKLGFNCPFKTTESIILKMIFSFMLSEKILKLFELYPNTVFVGVHVHVDNNIILVCRNTTHIFTVNSIYIWSMNFTHWASSKT